MLRTLRRLAGSLIAAVAIYPATRAASPATEEVETESEARLIAEHPMQAVAVRQQYLDNYKGPSMQITDELLARVRASRRYRNFSIDSAQARQETDQFIQERMR